MGRSFATALYSLAGNCYAGVTFFLCMWTSVEFRCPVSALRSARWSRAKGFSLFIVLLIVRLLADHALLVFAGVGVSIAGVWGVMRATICRAFLQELVGLSCFFN